MSRKIIKNINKKDSDFPGSNSAYCKITLLFYKKIFNNVVFYY
ncbi:Uncharacterized protein dnl_24290 [Desulfonema limicola]|uniref:Uncharacterized protein n=1 Tax=Desulfonema limicola TaxID=45656 RepID=A0A975B7E3_9BACT|nr:Uncharacterized protein dnl_24290 [Desulfonema limicola]